jgi:hypothetical protein
MNTYKAMAPEPESIKMKRRLLAKYRGKEPDVMTEFHYAERKHRCKIEWDYGLAIELCMNYMEYNVDKATADRLRKKRTLGVFTTDASPYTPSDPDVATYMPIARTIRSYTTRKQLF